MQIGTCPTASHSFILLEYNVKGLPRGIDY